MQRIKSLASNHVPGTWNAHLPLVDNSTTLKPGHPLHWHFAETPVFSRDEQPQTAYQPIQAKAAVGQVDDPLELEADRIADEMSGTGMAAYAPVSGFPKMPAMRNVNGAEGRLAHSRGQALEPGMRALMESRFGSDFSQVRVHADGYAAQAADAANALAYTVGRQIVFGAGQYSPGTMEGRRLLAHELTHVVQQNGSRVNGQAATKVTGRATAGGMQRTPKNDLDDTAKKIIQAAKDTSKVADQRAINAVNDIVKAYYDPSMVDSVVYKEDEIGLSTTPVGKGKDIKGKITVGKDFLDHIDSFARRVLQVGHELEHVKQQREGMGGHNKSHEREFLAFYWEATQPAKSGTGRVPHSTRVDLIDEALRNYYCFSKDDQEKYAAKKDELLTLRSTEEHKGGHEHTDPPSSCPPGK